MRAPCLFIAFFAVVINGQATNTSEFTSYMIGLVNLLSSAGMSKLAAGLTSINTSTSGAALLEKIYATTALTVYAPVDEVGDGNTHDTLTSRRGPA
jgi:hypothetical protein